MMAARGSKGSRWRRARQLAAELHELLRASIDSQAESPALADISGTLVRLHRIGRNIRTTLSLIREEELRASVCRRVDAIADGVIERTSAQHPTERLKDLVGEITNYRAQRMVRTRVAERKRGLIAHAIETGALQWDSIITPDDGFGHGMDERVVELPLAFEVAQFQTPGCVLDAGASLNHDFLRALIDPPIAELTHFTQSGDREEARFAGSQVSYMFGDLRSMPFRDEQFDRIICISTLEHVGMNNTRYGAGGEHAPESSATAVRELMRVLAPGGTLLITVPYGVAADRGWYRTFGPADVSQVIDAAKSTDVAVRYYRFGGAWYLGDATVETIPHDMSDDDDFAVRAVAALRLRK